MRALVGIKGDSQQVFKGGNELGIDEQCPFLLYNHVAEDVHRCTLTPGSNENQYNGH